jgi:hypothetical protein
MAAFRRKGRPPLSEPGLSDEQVLIRTLEVSRKNYSRYPNVVGIGTGIKYSNGHPQDNKLCIHFYVRKKVKRLPRRKKLPKFVYARSDDGSVDYSTKIPTDIVELKRLKFACKSGNEIDVTGESGTITIIFRNRSVSANQSEFYLLTCAHVAGELRRSPPVDPSMRSSCGQMGQLSASTIVNSTERNNAVEYDIALAQIHPESTPQPEHQIIQSSATLRRFMSSEDIRAGMPLECAFPRSNVTRANVMGLRTSLPLAIDGREYTVHNLFLIDQQPRPGDSGGLLYEGDNAVGILVGMADGRGLFQPLSEAFAHLQKISPVAIQCF